MAPAAPDAGPAGAIPTAGGRSAGADVEHYDLLRSDTAGEDVRRQVAADAVRFLDTQLRDVHGDGRLHASTAGQS